MSYSLQANKSTTLSASLAAAATSATLSSAVFTNFTGDYLVIDYDNPSLLEIVSCNVTGTAVASMTRGTNGTSAQDHASGAKVMYGFVPKHYEALVPVASSVITFTDSASDDGANVTAVTADGWKDITNLTRTITTRGGDVLVGFTFPFDNTTASGTTLFRILDASTAKAKFSANPGSVGPRQVVSGSALITGLTAGSHTIKMQMNMLAGGGATARAFYGQSSYFVTEVSS